MQFDKEFINELKKSLSAGLPGETAQYRMAPGYRPKFNKEQVMSYNPKVGGVLLLLYFRNSELTIVFTQRKAYDGVHGGQMSLPGGKKDETDTNIVATALRETKEEIGIAANQIEIIGSLSELYIPPSNFLVYPTVGFGSKIESFIPEETEVDKIVEIPVAFFLNKSNINMQTEIKLFNGTKVSVPAFIYNQHIIWGATAIILSEFVYIVEEIING